MSLREPTVAQVRRTVGFVRRLVETFRAAHVPFLAGSIAYAAFVSLLPLLVLVVLLASAVGGEEFATAVIDLTETYLSPTGQTVIAETLERATARTGLSILSLAVLVWATLRLFRGLDLAFSLLYGTADDADFVGQVVDGIVVLSAMALAISGTVLASVLIALAPNLPYAGVLDKLLLVGFLTVTLLPIFYVFPDRPLTVGDVLPGTVVTAVGWTALQAGFTFYVGLSSTAEIYGVVGGIILLVTWLYFGALAMLVGATVNVVLTEGIQPGLIDSSPH